MWGQEGEVKEIDRMMSEGTRREKIKNKGQSLISFYTRLMTILEMYSLDCIPRAHNEDIWDLHKTVLQ